MAAALIRRSVFRRRSNRSFTAGTSRSWLEAVPYATGAVAAGFLDKPFAVLHAAEAVLMLAVWSFWYKFMFGGRKS